MIIENNPKWGSQQRDIKAFAILQTIKKFKERPLIDSLCVDIGCGSGGITYHLSPYFKNIIGIDPEPWQLWIEYKKKAKNIFYIENKTEKLSILDSSVDYVVCNQVYEHVSNPEILITQIYRILKPGGLCYFSGPNILSPIEQHVMLPFVHWLPRRIGCYISKTIRPNSIFDANATHYWKILRWLRNFFVTNAVPYIIKNPSLYKKDNLLWRILSCIPNKIIDNMTWISPTFVFILKK